MIIGDVHQFIGHCLISLDLWFLHFQNVQNILPRTMAAKNLSAFPFSLNPATPLWQNSVHAPVLNALNFNMILEFI